MWRSKLINIGIIVLLVVHLISYYYEVPEVVCKYCGFEPCNPNRSWQRITLYAIVWLFSYKDLLLNKKRFLCYVICSVSSGLMFNEIIKANQDWNKWIWIGFAITVLFPIFEYIKYVNHKK